MKITKNDLKKLVKEIVEATEGEAEWFVENDDTIVIEGFQLSDGRVVDVEVEFDGEWDDGAFDYEYGSIKGTHRYPAQFVLGDYWVERVTKAGTNEVIWQRPRPYTKSNRYDTVDKAANDDILSFVESIAEKVENDATENPPEPYEPEYEPDDYRGRI